MQPLTSLLSLSLGDSSHTMQGLHSSQVQPCASKYVTSSLLYTCAHHIIGQSLVTSHSALTLQLGWTLWPQPWQLTSLSASPPGLQASVPRHSVQIGTIGGF